MASSFAKRERSLPNSLETVDRKIVETFMASVLLCPVIASNSNHYRQYGCRCKQRPYFAVAALRKTVGIPHPQLRTLEAIDRRHVFSRGTLGKSGEQPLHGARPAFASAASSHLGELQSYWVKPCSWSVVARPGRARSRPEGIGVKLGTFRNKPSAFLSSIDNHAR